MNNAHTQLDGPRGKKLFCQSWVPQHNPRANIIIAHGLAEHSGRYEHVANDLCDAGYAVYALDHLGHGRSEGERCVVKKFNDYVMPLRKFVLSIKKQSPNTPVFVLGHSMGGLIVGTYLLDFQADVDGAILSAPAVMGRRQPSLGAIIKLLFTAIFSPTTGVLQLDAKGVSRVPAVVQAYIDDPLVYNGPIPAGLMLAMSKAMKQLLQKAPSISLPLLILQGEQDALVHPDGAKRLYERAASVDKQIELFEPSYHEVFNEPEYSQAKTIMLNWLDQQLAVVTSSARTAQTA